MSLEIHRSIQRKRVLKRAKELRVEPKLSPEVEHDLKQLYTMENKRKSESWSFLRGLIAYGIDDGTPNYRSKRNEFF